MTRTQTTYINRIALRAGKKGARPAEVGGWRFEKSATELKQKLLKCVIIPASAARCISY